MKPDSFKKSEVASQVRELKSDRVYHASAPEPKKKGPGTETSLKHNPFKNLKVKA